MAPPIKVDGNVIVDGNHRYVAGKVLGKIPETTPGTIPLSKAPDVKSVSDIGISDIDWGNR